MSVTIALAMAGCGGDDNTSVSDGGTTDGETSDVQTPEAEAGPPTPDAGAHDASTSDGGIHDSGMSDSDVSDGSVTDVTDGATSDGGMSDANDAAADATPDAAPPMDAGDSGMVGSVSFLNVVANQELETGFIIGKATGPLTQVGCQFDGATVVVATGTTSWKCPRPTTWKLGSRHTVTAGAWDGATLSAPVSATVYAAQNHDFNGDGYTDLAVGAPFANSNDGTVSIFYGSPSGIGTTANVTITAPSSASMFGFALVVADLRNTGYADLVVGLASFSTSFKDPGTLYVFDGGSSGVPMSASYALAAPALNNAAGGYSLAAGDYDGDGYQDVAVGYGAYNLFQGAVSFYKGGPTRATFDAMKLGTSGQEFGNFVGLGDFSGSGYASVAIAASTNTLVYAGSPSGIAATSSVTLAETGALNTAYTKRNGFADLVITGNAQAFVYYGSASGPSTSNATTVSDPNPFGWGTVVPGDVDLDGHDDVVFANPCRDSTCATGNALVFLGSATGVSTTSSATVSNPGTASEFGYSLGMGDLNGDGRFDLFVGMNASTVYLFDGTGTAGLFSAAPSLTLTGLADVAFSRR